MPCIPGRFKSTASKTECVDCDANTFSELPGSSSCENCGVGEKSEEGSANCLNCDAGEAGTGTDGACELCSIGRYRQSKKEDEWTFTIKTQDITASAGVAVTQTVSSDVVTGTLKTALIGADTKTIVVTDTKGGSFVSATDIVIGTGGAALTIAHADITSVGKVTPTDPKTCVACPAGWSSVLGSTKCQACEAGMYSTIVGSCKDCNSGQYRNSKTDPTSCVVCLAGKSSVLGSSKCQECEAGKHGKPEKPDGRCYDCPTGFSRKSNSLSSLTKCEQCIVGETTTKTGSATCEKW